MSNAHITLHICYWFIAYVLVSFRNMNRNISQDAGGGKVVGTFCENAVVVEANPQCQEWHQAIVPAVSTKRLGHLSKRNHASCLESKRDFGTQHKHDEKNRLTAWVCPVCTQENGGNTWRLSSALVWKCFGPGIEHSWVDALTFLPWHNSGKLTMKESNTAGRCREYDNRFGDIPLAMQNCTFVFPKEFPPKDGHLAQGVNQITCHNSNICHS